MMATHDFSDAIADAIDTRQSHRKLLSQQSGQLVSQLANFKAIFDELRSMSTPTQQAFLDTKISEFKLDAKAALGL